MLATLHSAIRDGRHLTRDEAIAAAETILEGGHDEEAVAQFLVALAEKGETAEEIAGFASALMARAIRIEAPEGAVDLCGTGGSGLPRFNVSTAAAFVVAACGVPVAKHGNKGSRQPDGSFDLIESLGLPVALPPEVAREALANVGLAFLFARAYHPIMKNVVGARKRAGRRTIFNLVGPLCNPAGVKVQVIGTAQARNLPVLAEALQMLGRRRALVVRGDPGIDELSVSGPSDLIEVGGDSIRPSKLLPTDVGINPSPYETLPLGLASGNAGVFFELLDKHTPPNLVDLVALNAGAVLYIAGRAPSIRDGCAQARQCLVDGRARSKWEEYRRFVNARCAVPPRPM